MAISDLTANVTFKRRSFAGLLVRTPSLWWRHYRVLRRENDRIVSAYAAWLLASRVLLIK